MRIFVVGTGRCGTRTFSQACKRISNFTSGHETHARRLLGNLDYPDNHIEVDHHLGWALPMLLEKYPPGPDAYYVHLVRERSACVASLARRHDMDYFAALCCFVECSRRTPDVRRRAAEYYYDMRNASIAGALRSAQAGAFSARVEIENLPSAWHGFWDMIGARGDLVAALVECSKRYNRGLESKGEKVRDEH